MEFRVLGPLEVRVGGRRLPLRGYRQRAVLAALLLRNNQVVSLGELAEAVWPQPPPSAASNLRTHVTALRRLLAGGGEGTDRLVTVPAGYQLAVEHEELDVLVFDDLADRGEQALQGGDAGEAAVHLQEALALWRGPVLMNVSLGPVMSGEVSRLEERVRTAAERCAAARSLTGDHERAIAQLRRLLAEDPMREGLRAELMRALYRMGRQAEALFAYQQARRQLQEELGIEPGPSLRRLEHAILIQDPSLELS